VAPSRELVLAIHCCRAAFARGEASVVLSDAQLDWSLFLRLVRFHRVQGLAWSALTEQRDQVPREIAEALADDAAAIAAANLRNAVECRNLLADFERAEVPLLFMKGLTLGALAYGNATIKAAIDIDLLVAEQQLVAAARLLQRRGYELNYPDIPSERLRAWHRERKESAWVRPAEASPIDLHTRLSDNRALIPSLSVHSPRQSVEVAKGIALPTLGPDELFAYLCVHGASSAWFRLKWIADFAALLHGRSGDELDRLCRRSQKLGAGRAAGQALLLADSLFGSLEANAALREVLNEDAANRWLCRAALRQLAGKPDPVEPTGRPFGTTTIHLTQFALLPGLRFKLAELVRQLRTAL
jgi:hypothetical protein